MPSSQEQVLITINAVDNASSIISNIRNRINSLSKSVQKAIPDFSKTISQPVQEATGSINSSIQSTSYSMRSFGETSRTAGSKASMGFTEAAATMEKYHVGLNRVTNAMTGLFGTMGLFGMAEQSWLQATQRQTNNVYLSMRRGTDEAKSMYNEIMQIVMELPGDDTFLTTILTQASGRDLTMTADGIRNLGDAIADYYIAATAKGQLTYETQRELTSYILTGETRMFTNSVLAAEIDLLKDKNTVTERATALQKALTHAGYEGMAHYKTATNALEEFKGHFQKAFADLGSLALPFIQTILGVYNSIDSLFNGGISASIITFATSIALFTTTLGVIGFITPMINEGITSLVLFGNVIGNVRTGIAEAGGVFSYLSKHIRNLYVEATTLITPMQTIEAVTWEQYVSQEALNTAYAHSSGSIAVKMGATELDTQAILRNTMATTQLNASELALKITNDGLTASKFASKLSLDANTMALLEETAALVGVNEAELLNMAMESEMTTQKYLLTLQTNYNTIAEITNAEAISSKTAVENFSITTMIREGATKLYNTVITGLGTIATLLFGDAKARENAVRNSSILTGLRELGVKLQNIASNLIERISMVQVVDGQRKFNREKAIGIIERLQEIVATINETAAKIVNSIITAENTAVESLSNKEKLIAILQRAYHITLIIAETVAFYGLAAAGLVVDAVFSPMVLTLMAIVGAVLLVIGAIEQFGQAMGWWTDFGSMLDAITSGIGRLWEAFLNSEPIQFLSKLIDTFGNFITGTFGVLMDFFGDLFGMGGESNGSFDFVQSLINAFGNLYDVVSTVFNIIFPIFPLLQGIAYWMEVFENAWNQFVGSSEFGGMMEALAEVGDAFLEPFQELWSAFEEVGAAISEVFGVEEEGGDNATENINWIIGGLKMIANFIKNYVAPALKTLVQITMPILWIIRGIAGIIHWAMGDNNNSSLDTKATMNYTNTPNLTRTNNVNTNSNTVVVNHNYSEGSIPIDARNMTKDEASKVVAVGIGGYNKAYGVGGVMR